MILHIKPQRQPTCEEWAEQMRKDLKDFIKHVASNPMESGGQFPASQPLGHWDEDFQDWQNERNQG